MDNTQKKRGELSSATLQDAFAQKAQLAVKYMIYADQAQRDGRWAEAEALNAVSRQELKQAETILFRLSYFTYVDDGKPINVHNLRFLLADEESFIQNTPGFIQNVNSEGFTHTGTALSEIMAEDKLHLVILDDLIKKSEEAL